MASTLRIDPTHGRGAGVPTLSRSIKMLLLLGSVLLALNCAPLARAAGPCDIYASANTPCVAAHSTTRALYSSYTGRLYQVRRSSDGSTVDVGVLSDGYANAAAQDNFCTNTACTITVIYDQSANHNDLSIAPPGGAARGAGPNGYDLGAPADALPITAGGHQVYGVEISAGMGYRNNVTRGVAVNGHAESMYMVTSGTHFDGDGSTNNGCCFDYGNAETNSLDNGASHMDAINFSRGCPHPLGDRKDATWIVRRGLANSSCISFESKNYPGDYLRHQNSLLYKQPFDGSLLMRSDATFCPKSGNNGQGNSFSAVAFSTQYIRHYNGMVYIASDGGPDAWDNANSWTDETSFKVTPPLAP